jgi:1,4-alpha-glucan branching enzyme
MPSGYLCFVLHAHLPFVRHPEHNDFLEEDWFYEGITETYIPLLEMMEGWERDGIDWRLTMSVTPTLAAMFDDPLLQSRYVRNIDNLLSLSEKEVRRARFEPAFHKLAKFYYERFQICKSVFTEKYSNNLLNGFRRFHQTGKLELITCCATHGFLPLMIDQSPEGARVQIEQGAREHQRHFGVRPKGIWLAECGYAPGVDNLLADAGIKYFFVDTHGVLFSTPRPRHGIFAPILCPGTRVAAIARDTESSKQVWSSIEGYPGDPAYREFYRDVGFDAPEDYIKPHLHEIGIRTHLGMKYYSITGATDKKKPYDRPRAMEQSNKHAAHFLEHRIKQTKVLEPLMEDRPPLILAPYDAELFGHWWYEGPEFLDNLFRKTHSEQNIVRMITIPEYMEAHPVMQECRPLRSSWGAGGYAEVWLNPTNDWIYPHLHEAARRMTELVDKFTTPTELQQRAMTVAARELLLAQASDWAFIMKTGTVVEYAHKRTKEHVDNFNSIYVQLNDDTVKPEFLSELEWKSTLFPTLDYRLYQSSLNPNR